MSVAAIAGFSQQLLNVGVSAQLDVAAARRQLNQQKLEGQATLKLMEAAAVPVAPNIGQNIDIQV